MEEHIKKYGQAVCPECGQKLGFEVKNQRRKTQLIKCPVCKKFSWTATDKVEACLVQLARYEESGFYPEQLIALRFLWKACMKYPELKQKLEEYEGRIGVYMFKKKE